MPGGRHGTSIKWPKLYEKLRAKGYPKSMAAAISNAAHNRRQRRVGRSAPGPEVVLSKAAYDLGVSLLAGRRTAKVVPHAGGVVIVVPVPEAAAKRLAVPGGLPPSQLHLTLAHIMGSADWRALDRSRRQSIEGLVAGATAAVAAGSRPLHLSVVGSGTWWTPEGECHWAAVDAPGLDDLRHRLVEALGSALSGTSAEVSRDHSWTPHITIGYDLAEAPPVPVDLSWALDAIELWAGPARRSLPLGGVAVVKSDAERRYTFGPVYLPLRLDAHGDWSDSATLQEAVWGYVRNGDRTIPDQHVRGRRAGEWVELAVWPHPVDAELSLPGQEPRRVSFAAGTPFMGVVWDPEPWERVKAGKLRGLSLGGWAQRVVADIAT